MFIVYNSNIIEQYRFKNTYYIIYYIIILACNLKDINLEHYITLY